MMNFESALRSEIVKAGIVLEGPNPSLQDLRVLKVDVGLSSNAPQSSKWLTLGDPCELIIGFEPSPKNVRAINAGTSKFDDKLDPSEIQKRLFVLEAALGERNEIVNFYETSGDSGCSSLLPPIIFDVDQNYSVKCFCLDDVWKMLRVGEFTVVSHLKTDCQGTDLQVLNGARQVLRQVLFVTSEAENRQYEGSHNGKLALFLFMSSQGFLFLPKGLRKVLSWILDSVEITTDDPTFINGRRLHEALFGGHKIWQKG